MQYFSLFSGVGGFEIGIEKAYEDIRQGRKQGRLEGVRYLADAQGNEQSKQRPSCVGFSEVDKYASAVLRYRFPSIKNYGDITKIDWSTVPDFDLLVGGSPCQSFSIAGKRTGFGGASGLFWEYLRCLKEKEPQHFIWENVKGVLSSNGGRDFAAILTAFSEAGYSITWQVLNAKDFGVPQNRERVFVIGTRGERGREVFFERNNNSQNNKIVELTSQVSDSQRTFDPDGVAPALRAGGGGMGAKTGLYAVRQPLRFLQRNQKKIEGDYAFTVDAGQTSGIRITGINHPSRGIEPRKDGLAASIKAGQSGSQRPKAIVYDRVRRLTPRECERLMSWPDDWTRYGDFDGVVKEISDSQRYKMCGNGVVSEVVRKLVEYTIL